MNDPHDPNGVRLQKVLAGAGVASRRASELLISAGRVTVNGVKVRELGTRVDPKTSIIHVDGDRIQLDETIITLALNKPVGVVSSMHDEFDRPDLSEFVDHRDERLFHVGRLDADTDGLILLTNDGELGHRLAHPSYEVPKVYVAHVEGLISRSLSRDVIKGIVLEDGLVTVDEFILREQGPDSAIIEVTLHEGRKHVVRRLFEEVGHPVIQLTRIQFGPIRLGNLKPGRTRVIGGAELGGLMRSVDM